MPFAVSFVGFHNTGKTTLLAAVAKELMARGLKVGALKSSKEERPHLERPGADTEIFWIAGVQKVAFWGAKEGLLRYHVPEKDDFSFWYYLNRFFPEEEIVLCEGFKKIRSLPKLEIVRPGGPEPLFAKGLPGLIAVISPQNLQTRLPVLPPDPKQIATFILERRPQRKAPATLLVDGKPVGLTRFVAKALAESVKGFVRTLRGVRDPKVIELRIDSFEDQG